jgi:hypothetical protein
MLLLAEQSSRRLPPGLVSIHFLSASLCVITLRCSKFVATNTIASVAHTKRCVSCGVGAYPVLPHHSIESAGRVFARDPPRGDSIAPVVHCRDAGNDAVWDHNYGVRAVAGMFSGSSVHYWRRPAVGSAPGSRADE